MKIEFADYVEGFGGELKCPSCKEFYLHHQRIDIYEREEGEKTGLHITVENLKITTDQNLEGNPSRDRHGLTITFWCEHCDAAPKLSLSQHKGNTWVDFNHDKTNHRRSQNDRIRTNP